MKIVEMPKDVTAQRKEYAEHLRKVANKLESGEYVTVIYAVTVSEGDQFKTGIFRSNLVKDIELAGQAAVLQDRILEEL